MALNDLYVDGAGGSDTNGGTSEGAAVVSGTVGSTNGTATVTLDSGSDLSGVSVGDGIRLAGETNGKNGSDIFEITGVDDPGDTVTVTPTPGTGSGLTWAIGGAWATIDRSMNVVSAGDKAWIKASAAYTETATIDTAGTSTAPVVLEGYSTTPGDGGQITIDGESTRANGIAAGMSGDLFYALKNIRVTGCTSHGFAFGSSGDFVRCKNCRADNNGGDGFNGDDRIGLVKCQADNNSGIGVNIDTDGALIACAMFLNGAEQAVIAEGIVFGGLVYGLTANQEGIVFDSSLRLDAVIHCTIDGENGTGTQGIAFVASPKAQLIVINSLLHDLDTGVRSSSDEDEMGILWNNLFNSCNTDESSAGPTVNKVTGAPSFVDEAGDDYRLGSDSPARKAGLDAGQPSYADIGAIQSGHVRRPRIKTHHV